MTEQEQLATERAEVLRNQLMEALQAYVGQKLTQELLTQIVNTTAVTAVQIVTGNVTEDFKGSI